MSNLGDGVTLVAGPLLAATLTRDPRLVAGLAVAQRLPWLLFSLVSGALVDRLDRRRLMVRVDAARCAAVGLLGVAVAAGVAWLVADRLTAPLAVREIFAATPSGRVPRFLARTQRLLHALRLDRENAPRVLPGERLHRLRLGRDRERER